MPLYCRTCWERDNVLAAEVEQRDVEDPRRGYLKDCLVCIRCLSLDAITRVSCRTFKSERALRGIRADRWVSKDEPPRELLALSLFSRSFADFIPRIFR